MTVLSGIFKGDGGSIVPIPIPAMPKFGYFQGVCRFFWKLISDRELYFELRIYLQYNNSRDEEYWIETGKKDINQIGNVQRWAGITELPGEWWTTPKARSIRGSGELTIISHWIELNLLNFNAIYFKHIQKESILRFWKFHSNALGRVINCWYVLFIHVPIIHKNLLPEGNDWVNSNNWVC